MIFRYIVELTLVNLERKHNSTMISKPFISSNLHIERLIVYKKTKDILLILLKLIVQCKRLERNKVTQYTLSLMNLF